MAAPNPPAMAALSGINFILDLARLTGAHPIAPEPAKPNEDKGKKDESLPDLAAITSGMTALKDQLDRFKKIEEENEKLKTEIETVKTELEVYKAASKEQITIIDNLRKARDELAGEQGAHPFAAAILDFELDMFIPSLFHKGERGGRLAARLIHDHIEACLPDGCVTSKFFVFVFLARSEELVDDMIVEGVVRTKDELEQFILGFNSSNSLYLIVESSCSRQMIHQREQAYALVLSRLPECQAIILGRWALQSSFAEILAPTPQPEFEEGPNGEKTEKKMPDPKFPTKVCFAEPPEEAVIRRSVLQREPRARNMADTIRMKGMYRGRGAYERPKLDTSKDLANQDPPLCLLYYFGPQRCPKEDCTFCHAYDLLPGTKDHDAIAYSLSKTPCPQVNNDEPCFLGRECFFAHACKKGANCPGGCGFVGQATHPTMTPKPIAKVATSLPADPSPVIQAFENPPQPSPQRIPQQHSQATPQPTLIKPHSPEPEPVLVRPSIPSSTRIFSPLVASPVVEQPVVEQVRSPRDSIPFGMTPPLIPRSSSPPATFPADMQPAGSFSPPFGSTPRDSSDSKDRAAGYLPAAISPSLMAKLTKTLGTTPQLGSAKGTTPLASPRNATLLPELGTMQPMSPLTPISLVRASPAAVAVAPVASAPAPSSLKGSSLATSPRKSPFNASPASANPKLTTPFPTSKVGSPAPSATRHSPSIVVSPKRSSIASAAAGSSLKASTPLVPNIAIAASTLPSAQPSPVSRSATAKSPLASQAPASQTATTHAKSPLAGSVHDSHKSGASGPGWGDVNMEGHDYYNGSGGGFGEFGDVEAFNEHELPGAFGKEGAGWDDVDGDHYANYTDGGGEGWEDAFDGRSSVKGSTKSSKIGKSGWHK